MEEVLKCRIVTTTDKYFDQEAIKVSAELTSDNLAFLPGHVNYFGVIEEGVIEVTTQENEIINFVLFDGMISCRNGSEVVISALECYKTSEISVAYEESRLAELKALQQQKESRKYNIDIEKELRKTIKKIGASKI